MGEKADVVSPKQPPLVRLSGGAKGSSPGLPMNRLSSFKAPRDLSLGSPKTAEKKKFVPNFNVARVKRDPDEPKIGVKKEGGAGTGKQRKKQDHRKDKKDKKERPELIQTMGSVFSEGVGPGKGIRRRIGGGGGEGRGEGGNLVRPKMEAVEKMDPDEEAARLAELLRDDFIDDLTSGGFMPVQLPMVDTGKIFKDLVKKDIEIGEEDIKPKLRRKPTELDSDDDEDTVDDVKPLKQEVKASVQPPTVAPEVSFTDLVRNQKGDLLFVQLPDVLPGQAVKREDGGYGCDMASLGEGLLGKLQIRRSGACQLLLGDDQVMDVAMGTKAGFLQDAVSLNLGEGGNRSSLNVLGHVRHKMVVTPNWDNLLSARATVES